jgi:hypothetical protein
VAAAGDRQGGIGDTTAAGEKKQSLAIVHLAGAASVVIATRTQLNIQLVLKQQLDTEQLTTAPGSTSDGH